jgi:hypothetical protein
MSVHSISALLGGYAILQNNIFANSADKKAIETENLTLYARRGEAAESEQMPPTQLERLTNMSLESQEILLSATTVFPFILFPDTINIDRQKLTVVHRSFFRAAKIASVQIKDIRNIEANLGPLFGSLTLTSKHFLNNTQTINFLKRSEIIQIQRSIQGLMIAEREGVDTRGISKEQLMTLANTLGKGSSN